MVKEKGKPPYELTPQVLNLVADICEVLGHISAQKKHPAPKLRRENRIKTIQSSLAIEGNSLSLEQVTAVIGKKRVLGVPREIQEVRNAFEAYEGLAKWNPLELPHLLEAHSVLMTGLVDRPGHFRSGGVGIQRGKDIVHLAPPAGRVPSLVKDLLHWLEKTDAHPLLASSAFHYDFEFIHPFADGNGRLGRLWQTLLLSKWSPVFASIPVESVIHDRQEGYYEALRKSDAAGDGTLFIVFMLESILAACKEVNRAEKTTGSQKTSQISSQKKLLAAMRSNPKISIAELSGILKLSDRSVKNLIAKLKAAGTVKRIGPDKGGFWQVDIELIP